METEWLGDGVADNHKVRNNHKVLPTIRYVPTETKYWILMNVLDTGQAQEKNKNIYIYIYIYIYIQFLLHNCMERDMRDQT